MLCFRIRNSECLSPECPNSEYLYSEWRTGKKLMQCGGFSAMIEHVAIL